MEPIRHYGDVVRELTRDFAPRTAQRSSASVRRRVTRLRERVFFILQCAVSAGIAWFLATRVLGHPEPFLAPVAAIICLGMSFGQRYRRVVEVSVGVGVGVLIGTGFAHVFGVGPWQIAVVAFAAMSIAVLLGASVLLVSQAGAQSVIVIALVTHQASGLDRWFDALVGAGVAVLVTLFLPVAPISKPRTLAARMLDVVAGLLHESATAIRVGDLDLARQTLARSRATEEDLDAFEAAADEGVAFTRHSVVRGRNRTAVRALAELGEPIDRAVRNVRVLARRAVTAVRKGEPVPDDLLDLLDRLGFQVGRLAAVVLVGDPVERIRAELIEIAEASVPLDPGPSLSGAVVLAQTRSIVVDLLQLTGMSGDAARALFGVDHDDHDHD